LKVAGGYNQLAKALRMPDMRDEIKEVIMSGKHYRLNPNITPDWAKTRTIVECSEEKFLNKTVAQIAEELGVDDLDALMNIISVDPETKAIRKGDDDWVKLEYYKHPEIMIGVDTFAVDETNEGRHLPPSLPNENAFGGHVRYLRRTVRETNTLTWEEAIRKLTSSPARKFKMTDRGILKCGAYADIVILNPETVTDRGDQLEPRRYPEGIDHVIVNGELVVSGSEHTGALPGKILYRE
jgi:N-acyl-D-amino-acid deacylase